MVALHLLLPAITEVVHFGRSPGFTFGVRRRNKMKDDKVDAHHGSRGSSLLESFTKLVTLDDEEGVAPLVEENVDNSPNPFEQSGTILMLFFSHFGNLSMRLELFN